VFCVYCVIIVFFSVNCVIYVCLQYFDTIGWVLRPVKNRRPYNLYCVGGDVKPCSINQQFCHKDKSMFWPFIVNQTMNRDFLILL